MAARHALPDPRLFPWRTTTASEALTEDLGRRLGLQLAGGEIILLHGDLGTGKTCLTRGICRGLGITGEIVSPTFTLVNTYPGRLTVHHLDFYRIEDDAPLEDIGIMEILDEVGDGRAVLVAEWPGPLLGELAGMESVHTWLGTAGEHGEERIWRLAGPQAADLAQALGLDAAREDPC